MEEQASYNNRRVKRPKSEELIQAITRLREIAEVTKQSLILDENRTGIAIDSQNQALLENYLTNSLRITDLYFT